MRFVKLKRAFKRAFKKAHKEGRSEKPYKVKVMIGVYQL